MRKELLILFSAAISFFLLMRSNELSQTEREEGRWRLANRFFELVDALNRGAAFHYSI